MLCGTRARHEYHRTLPVDAFNLDSLSILDGPGKGDCSWLRVSGLNRLGSKNSFFVVNQGHGHTIWVPSVLYDDGWPCQLLGLCPQDGGFPLYKVTHMEVVLLRSWLLEAHFACSTDGGLAHGVWSLGHDLYCSSTKGKD